MTALYKKGNIIFVLLIIIGICLRFFVMNIGYNFDFESYCIVGEISGNFRNVYAETSRYNYGPIFFILQGTLYKISYLFSNWTFPYRILMVFSLTLTDLGITYFLAERFDKTKSLLFFLNPVSIIITGYHNQFDNIAVFLALISIVFYNENKKFNKKDLFFVLFLTLSLITKHLLFIFPLFILFKKGLPMKKKIVYSFVPPMLFLASFIPFALQSSEALNGIINNVFLYRSFNNAPLFCIFYDVIGFPLEYSIIIFGLSMAVIAFLIRGVEYDKQILIYFIAMVALSSAIANQYLVIPLASVIILETKFFKYIYIFFATIYLLLESNGLGLMTKFVVGSMSEPIINICEKYIQNAYTVLAWILFITMLYYLFKTEKIQIRIKNKE